VRFAEPKPVQKTFARVKFARVRFDPKKLVRVRFARVKFVRMNFEGRSRPYTPVRVASVSSHP
jgi:hypothetical protein